MIFSFFLLFYLYKLKIELFKKKFIELLENHETSITSSKEFNQPLRLFQEKLESLKLLSKQNIRLRLGEKASTYICNSQSFY